ncbi:MAG: Asp23/Gls24 family envelope stress response protein [bacterium]
MTDTNVKKMPAPGNVSPDQHDLAGDHIEEGTELGTVQIHHNVIATIARMAVTKVPGVVEMSGGLVDGLAGMIGKKGSDRGIRVDVQDNSVVIEAYVVVEYGVRIPHVAWEIQNEVRQAVEQMTGKAVKSVQVNIESVRFPADGESASRDEEVHGV